MRKDEENGVHLGKEINYLLHVCTKDDKDVLQKTIDLVHCHSSSYKKGIDIL